jgi:CMP-N-acetylneuraminic acid synthetase
MICALLPIKEESERLVGKNFLSFNGQPLFRVMLDTLSGVAGEAWYFPPIILNR